MRRVSTHIGWCAAFDRAIKQYFFARRRIARDTDCWIGNPEKAARELAWCAKTGLKTELGKTAEQLRYTI